MNKSQRIKTEVGSNVDKHIKIKLEQDTKSVEILSLKISQKDIYQSFNCDYGLLIGRVLANGGVGIPNARISIFIPISDVDKERPEINAVYPYSTPRDKNADGTRYNLLPRIGRTQTDGTIKPQQPFGSFPIKEEILANDTLLEVYETYYKYSTVTNLSGDYMLFGVPIGVQTVHLSVDITDIGKYSMNPLTMVTNLGYSPNLFTNNGTKIKQSSDLADLPNIETQEISVEIIPFCGDSDIFDIGISRQDFRIRAVLTPTFVVFGAAFTDEYRASWGQNEIDDGDTDQEMWRINHPADSNISINNKRIGKIVIDVYYISPNINDADADAGNFSTEDDLIKLDKAEYSEQIRDGDFNLIIPCNRNRVITDESGVEIPVDNTNPNGVFTQFRGMFMCTYAEELPTPVFADFDDGGKAGPRFDDHTFAGQRWKIKIPQTTAINYANEPTNELWRKEHKIFTASKNYSVAKFHHLNFRNKKSGPNPIINNINLDPFNNVGIISTDSHYDSDNPSKQFPSNGTDWAAKDAFGAEYLNFCLHFPQHTYFIRDQELDRHGNDAATFNPTRRFYYLDNTQQVLGKDTNSKNILRGDYHITKFIEVPSQDIVNIYNNALNLKGFKSTQAPFDSLPLIGTEYEGTGGIKYFYRGIGLSDCIKYLIDNGIIST